MNKESYKDRLEEVLTVPLDTESPDNLYKQATIIESLSYLAIKYQAEAEVRATTAESRMRQAGKAISEYNGTATDRKMKWEADCAPLFEEAENARTEARYWLNIGKAIERKVILAQSVLSNITASVKAGIR
jgi:hypothetical protein